MLASCPRSRRNDVSLTVTSSISRVIELRAPARVGDAAQERLGVGAGADAVERRQEERVLMLARAGCRSPRRRGPRPGRARASRREPLRGAASAAARRCGSGSRMSSAPCSAAALGIPKTAELASSCAIVSPPARRTSPSPAAPSLPMPVSTTATPSAPAPVATLRSRTSADGRCGPFTTLIVEHEPARGAEDEMRALGRDPDPGRRRAGAGEPHASAAPGRRATRRSRR